MKKLIQYFGLLFGVMALSTSAIFVKIANAPSAVTAFYRLLFTLLVLLPFAVCRKAGREEIRRLSKKQVLLSILAGMFLGIHYVMWFESLNYTSVASSTVIVTLQPVFTIILAYLFAHEKQNRVGIAGCAIALIGSFIIGYGDFQVDSRALWGDLLALIAAGIISAYFFMGQNLRKSMSAVVYSILGYCGSVVFLAVYAVIQGQPFFGYSPITWKCFLALAIVSTVMGQFIFNLLLKWLPATMISMSILGEPVGTCILAYFILNEVLSVQQGIGIVIILGGLAVYFFSAPINNLLIKKKT